jgi:membrane protease YdiL (CAAX protease family)
LLAFDLLVGSLFHAGGGAAMLPIELASGGWIHHSLAWGAITSSVFAALALAAGVRLRHLGIDRRELGRWITTWAISWCAVQVMMVCLAQLGLVPQLQTAATLPASVGVMFALLVHTGLFEEIMARGILLPVLVRRFGAIAGISLAAAAFALGHLPLLLHEDSSFGDALGSLSQFWFWAVVANVLYLRSASLLTVAALHTVQDWPTPFAIDSRTYAVLLVGVSVGGFAYIWLRRWPTIPSRTVVAAT